MILQQPKKEDFLLQKGIKVDTENKGFDEAEMERLAESAVAWETGGKGGKGWWKQVWVRGRNTPPALSNLESEFVYQTAPMLTNLLAVAEAQGTALEGQIKASAARYDFYIMRCGVYIAPEGGETFEALKFQVTFKEPGVSTYTMLPGPQSKTHFAVGGKADIGVDGRLQFGIPETSIQAATMEAAAKAELEAKFIVSFQYEFKTPVVDSFGVGTPFCKWVLHEGKNLRNDIVFYPIIRTPKSLKEFQCDFKAFFKIGHPEWKNSDLFLKDPITVDVYA